MAETKRGFLGCTSEKGVCFGKNLFNFYHEQFCALTIEWATKPRAIVVAVKPLVDLDK